MGRRLPSLRARDIIKVLNKLGFVELRQTGAHKFFKHPDGRVTVIPVHPGNDLGRGLLRQILREIEMQPEEFLDYL